MIKMYLKLALRNLLRNKIYSFIIIAGLSIGMAVAILILSYVWFERSFDRFNSKYDQIYRVVQSTRVLDEELDHGMTGLGLAPALKEEFPEILHITRLSCWSSEIEISHNEKKIIKKEGDNSFVYADNDIFKIFDIELIHGDKKTALQDPNSIILIEEESRKLFGNENPIGKLINIHSVVEEGRNNDLNLKVTGVAKAMPDNSHFEFKYLISHEKNYRLSAWPFTPPLDDTYLTLPVDYPTEDLENKFPEFVRKYFASEIGKQYSTTYDDWLESGGYWKLRLQPLKDVHLNKVSYVEGFMIKKGNLFHVQLLTIIALLIIILASINFITLSIAKSGTRAKEVGVRKVNGATKRQLIWQFLIESILLSIVALLFAVIMIRIFSESFNKLLEIQNPFGTAGFVYIFTALFVLILIVGVIAGSFPAFFLSSYRPVNVLKGQPLEKGKGMTIRNSLIVFQFIFSIVLIVSSVMVYKQLVYIDNKELGFQKENIVIIKDLIGMYYEEPNLSQDARQLKFATLRQEILKHPAVVNATLMSAMPGNSARNFNMNIRPEGATTDAEIGITSTKIDGAYLDVFGLELATGQNFKKELTIPQNVEGVIINEKAAHLFEFKNPVGKYIEAEIRKNITTAEGKKKHVREKEQLPIIGVFKDFHNRDLYEDMTPTIFFPQYNDDYFGYFMAVRFLPGNISDNVSFLETTWNNIAVRQPFEYEFFDKELENQYHKERKLVQILGFFTLLAIFIACLGIYGLAAFAAAKRTKEIGIRKVNGATIKEVILMLNKDFVKWVAIAFVIACPIAYYVMSKWLENFAYKTALSWWVFALAGLSTLIIAILTVSWQSYRAATRNPVEALRDE